MSSTVIPIWPGSSSFAQVSQSYYVTGSWPPPTPFGFYDTDPEFKIDANKVANFCALRLGYPIENVELQDINFWAGFEEAVTVYGNELYAYQTRDNYLSLEGASDRIDVNNSVFTPSMDTVIRISQQYGEEAGAGGNVTWNKGRLSLIPGQQRYDLSAWAEEQGIIGGIEIKNVWYQPPPAINQLYAPNFFGQSGGAGLGGVPAAGVYGFGYGYANYLMMPTSYTMQNIQAIEMQNQITLSNYTFNIINNILSVFPVPGTGFAGGDFSGEDDLYYGDFLIFDFIKIQDRIDTSFSDGTNKITNTSNVPYLNPTYSKINSVGRSWIFEYTLAKAKEVLGLVRNKYSQVPIPGAEVTLNGDSLITQATAEKESLITRLREYFDQTSRQALLERRAAESVARVQEINQVPMTIFIG
jgi:hypothetical protein